MGKLESEAREQQGIEVIVNRAQTADWTYTRRVNARHAGYKIIIDKQSREIIGAHITGPHAEDQINLFAWAMQKGITAPEIAHSVYAYPTATSEIRFMVSLEE